MLSIVNTLGNLIQHRLKPGVSSETKEERAREESTREGSLQLINILDYDLVFIPVLLPCHWALGTGMPCLQRHMNKQLLQKCFYFNKMPHNLICFLFSSCNFYSKISFLPPFHG
ncbi:uncharacterized protein LOC141877073 [Acropora palmata]|uniref:uncharacterized protein LOC141877073 n=1 Tax=Acropora palmata TaxID=6131 RepID=UPI003DA01058